MTITKSLAVICPDWCATSAEDHVREWQGGSTFHTSAALDEWRLDYKHAEDDVKLRAEVYSSRDEPDEALVMIDGDLGRGSSDLAELTVADARRLAAALIAACEQIERQA